MEKFPRRLDHGATPYPWQSPRGNERYALKKLPSPSRCGRLSQMSCGFGFEQKTTLPTSKSKAMCIYRMSIMSIWSSFLRAMEIVLSRVYSLWLIHLDVLMLARYSSRRGKACKTDEAVNIELNVTRSWNLVQTVDLAWFIAWMSFKLICIFYDFKAPLLENR